MFDLTTINVNYKSAIQQAEKLSSIASSITDDVKAIDSYINDLKTCWEGTNADKFINKVEASKNNLSSYADKLKEISSALKSAALAYRDAELNKIPDNTNSMLNRGNS